ncbi:MAG: glycosyltransferase family 2 protein [Bacteroides sp.]|nr:glycosyltransferase family 2 protein [Bacteroides sp.]MCM1094717.1 glycosyltransferase family 2 protein [Terasakiella sp.]
MDYKVSVIIPVYGAERYIERCARSLFGQTLREVEYIFVDDCTTDASMEVLRRVIEDYPARKASIRILSTHQNSGQHVARRLGIEQSRGMYITHCDPDDAYSDETVLETLYNFAAKRNLDILLWDILQENELTGEQSLMSQECPTDVNGILHTFLADFSIMASLCNRLVRAEIVKSDDIIWPISPINEDTLLVSQYHIRAAKVAYVPLAGYIYIRHRDSTTGVAVDKQRILDKQSKVMANMNLLFDLLRNQGYTVRKEMRNAIDYRKFQIKLMAIPVLLDGEKRSLYTAVYPEINARLLLNPLIDFRAKLINTAIMTGLFGLLHKCM